MIEAADKVFVLCDSSKIEKNSLFKLVPISKIDYLITDDGLSEETFKKYRESGVEILTAPAG